MTSAYGQKPQFQRIKRRHWSFKSISLRPHDECPVGPVPQGKSCPFKSVPLLCMALFCKHATKLLHFIVATYAFASFSCWACCSCHWWQSPCPDAKPRPGFLKWKYRACAANWYLDDACIPVRVSSRKLEPLTAENWSNFRVCPKPLVHWAAASWTARIF